MIPIWILYGSKQVVRGPLSSALLTLVFLFTCSLAWAQPATEQPLRVVMDSGVMAADGSRLTLDFGFVSFDDLNDMSQAQPGAEALLDDTTQQSAQLIVYVPKSLSESDRQAFIQAVEQAFQPQWLQTKLVVKEAVIDVEAVEAQAQKNNLELARANAFQYGNDPEFRQLNTAMMEQNNRWVSTLKSWSKGFGSWVKQARHFRKWTTQTRDMFLGTIYGMGRSYGSVLYWVSYTGVNPYGIAQALMSITLDTVFSRYENYIESFKARHRIPLFSGNPLVRLYNEKPWLKAFVVNNAIAFGTGFYFRLFSWLNNPSAVSSPWSAEALSTYFGAMSIGGVVGTMGGQGALTLRRKGYITGRWEYLIYQAYAAMMQIEGLLFGSGKTGLFWTVFGVNSVFKTALFAASRVLPPKTRRVIVMYPAFFDDKSVESIKYVEGVLDAEAIHDKKTLPELVERVKDQQSRQATSGFRAGMQKIQARLQAAFRSCQQYLSK